MDIRMPPLIFIVRRNQNGEVQLVNEVSLDGHERSFAVASRTSVDK